ncbi:hypothetical protein B0H11DRAFT_2237547 [Mycena galericulata]|nr:hypothetical protein B0H11DRAFT_2237547 [Mycena galericulata]
MPIELLDLWLTRSATADLHIEVCFEDLAEYYGAESVADRICEYATAMLPLLVSRILQWTYLCIDIESTRCLRQILLAIRAVPAPRLRTLEILSLPCGRNPAPDGQRLVPIPSGTLLGNSLRTLALYSVTADWFGFTCFNNLETLELCAFVLPNFPTWQEFVHVLRQAGRLRRLLLRSVGCRDFPDGLSLPVIVLPSLTELELEFGSHCSLAPLVCQLRVPKLETLILYLTTRPDVDRLVYCLQTHPPLFSTIRRLVITGSRQYGRSAIRDMARVYSACMMLRVLDISDAVPLFLQALLEATGTYNEVGCVRLPALQELWVAGLDAVSLRDLVKARQLAGTPIKRLFVDYPPTRDETSPSFHWPDLQYIQATVKTFAVPRMKNSRPTRLTAVYSPGVSPNSCR